MGLLSQDLSKIINSNTANDNGMWRQFVLDHLDYIARRTRPSDITAEMINLYRFDLSRFLKERMGILNDIAWIVLLLNDMSSDLDFKDPGIYIIPDDNTISALYSSYITIESNKT